MSKWLRKYRRKFLTGYGILLIVMSAFGMSFIVTHSQFIFNILASTVTSLSTATTTMFFRPYGDTTMKIDGTTSVDVNINARVPVNAIGVTISFPKDAIEILGISKEKSFFDLWTEDTTISEDTGEIHFSGGTTKAGGVMGTGTVITLLVRAKTSGRAQLSFSSVQVYPSDGSGDPLTIATHPISYTIEEQKKSDAGGASVPATGGSIIGGMTRLPPPDPDLNGDGRINLVDLSILTFRMLGGYDPRYDLNLSGSLGLDDLSVLMSKL